VSHNPERKEKNCLNCNANVYGRFCHICGQENVVTKESFWSMTKHFVYDILHFDGKFFHTLNNIFKKPGFVPRQYAEGKRASFLHPIRMYLFTSAVFFLIFFSFETIKVDDDSLRGVLTNQDRRELAEKYEKRFFSNPADSFLHKRIAILKDTTQPVNIDSLGWIKEEQFLSFDNRKYNSAEEYDSIQQATPENEKDGWLTQKLTRQAIKVNKKYAYGIEGVKAFIDTFVHQLPYLLFLSLPFFALILKLLYIRRKNFYYSDHAVFTLYHYIFSFILLLALFGIGALREWSGWDILGILIVLLLITWPVYLYLEMKRFYQQGWAKTLGKFLLLNILGFIVLIILFILFLFLSIFQL
jgi:uncharacterized membrane protein